MADAAGIESRVREVLGQVLDLPATAVGPDLTAESSGAWTSLNHLMLISQLEAEFGVIFSNQEIKDLTSYSAIVGLLGRRLGPAK